MHNTHTCAHIHTCTHTHTHTQNTNTYTQYKHTHTQTHIHNTIHTYVQIYMLQPDCKLLTRLLTVQLDYKPVGLI